MANWTRGCCIMNRFSWKISAAAFVWLLAVALLGSHLLEYENRSGAVGQAPAAWPTGSLHRPAPGRPTLLLFAHPHCPCTAHNTGRTGTSPDASPRSSGGRCAILESRGNAGRLGAYRSVAQGCGSPRSGREDRCGWSRGPSLRRRNLWSGIVIQSSRPLALPRRHHSGARPCRG